MCKECEVKQYVSFDELPQELKDKFKPTKITIQTKIGFLNFINELNKRGDKLVGDYVNAKTNVLIKFNKCGHVPPHGIKSDVYNRGGCPICSGKQVQQGVNDLTTTYPKLAKEWHPTKNGDLTPNMVTSGSGKKVWWLGKCGHEWEASISSRNGKKQNGCPVCYNRQVLRGYNDIVTTDPDLVKYFVNTEDAYTHTRCSHDIVKMICPDCGKEREMKISDLTKQGFSCPYCGDGVSYPNKVMALFVDSLGLEYELEYTIDGYSQFRFDIYLPKYGRVIENDGGQHYAYLDDKLKNKKIWNDKTGMEIHYIDLGKESVVMNKGWELIPIDCRESNIDYIRNSIEQCEFFKQFDLSNIDWQEIDIKAQESLKIDVCNRWKEWKEVNEDLTTTDLAEEFGISDTTIRRYLKWGNENGLCEYNGDEERQAKNERQNIFVYLIKPNGEKWFDKSMSQSELARQSGISVSTIKTHRQNGNSLEYKQNSKYDPKYIGSYVVLASEYDAQFNKENSNPINNKVA